MKIIALLFIFIIQINSQELWHLYDSSNSSIDEKNLYSLSLDSSQVVWLGERLALYRFVNGVWNKDFKSEIDDSLDSDYFIYDIQTSAAGDVWFTKARYWNNNVDNLFRYSNGNLYAHNVSNNLLEPHNLFVDENNQPWFVLYNYWPHQMGFDKIGTLEADTLRMIDLPWQGSFLYGYYKNEGHTLFICLHW